MKIVRRITLLVAFATQFSAFAIGERCNLYFETFTPHEVLKEVDSAFGSQVDFSDGLMASLERIDQIIDQATHRLNIGQGASTDLGPNPIGTSIYSLAGRLTTLRAQIQSKILTTLTDAYRFIADGAGVAEMQADSAFSASEIKALIEELQLNSRGREIPQRLAMLEREVQDLLIEGFFSGPQYSNIFLSISWGQTPPNGRIDYRGSLEELGRAILSRFVDRYGDSSIVVNTVGPRGGRLEVEGAGSFILALHMIGRYRVEFMGRDGRMHTHYFRVDGGSSPLLGPRAFENRFFSTTSINPQSGEAMDIFEFQNLGAGGQNAQTSNNGRRFRYTPPAALRGLAKSDEVEAQYYGRSVEESTRIGLENFRREYEQWCQEVLAALADRSVASAYALLGIERENPVPFNFDLDRSAVPSFPYSGQPPVDHQRSRAIMGYILDQLDALGRMI